MDDKVNAEKKKAPRRDRKLYKFNKFPRYKEIQYFIRDVAKKFPNKAEVRSIGKTFHGRDIDMIIIAKDPKNPKQGVLIDGGIHAREWLTITTVLYFINHLITDNNLLNLMDFYIIPCLNPDGYEFTHTVDRLWRKNVNPNGSFNTNRWGVDLNRNFPHKFGKKGSSKNPSSFMYRGEGPLSEPESKSLSDVMHKYKDHLKLYISVHSYGNVILYPWSHTKKPVDDRDILDTCGHEAKLAIYKCSKRWFRVGTAASQMYLTSGSSTDYAAAELNIKFSFAIELQKLGKSGFQPRRKHIKPVGKDTVVGIKTMVEYVHKYYRDKLKHKNNQIIKENVRKSHTNQQNERKNHANQGNEENHKNRVDNPPCCC